MKKRWVYVLLAFAMFLFAGCAPKNPLEEAIDKAADILDNEDKLMEAVLDDEDTLTVETDEGTATFSDDGENIEIITDDATFVTNDNLVWPAEYMGGIPELEGKISYVASSEDGANVAFKDIAKQQAEAYAEKLKSMGYEGMNMTDEEGGYFMGTNKQGDVVNFSFTVSGGEATVAYTPAG